MQPQRPPTPCPPSSIFTLTQQTLHLYTKMSSPQYNPTQQSQIQQDLYKFYNGLIQSQKKNPLLLYQLFEMKTCENILQKFINRCPVDIMKNCILVMNNCQVGGLVAQLVLDARYPSLVLEGVLGTDCLGGKFVDSIGEYMGGFLKAYYKLFKIEWLPKFINNTCFQLLQLTLKYYNHPDLITRTSCLNIILGLLSHKQIQCFIKNSQPHHNFYPHIFSSMCRLFRNELVQFGLRIAHIGVNDYVEYIFGELQDKVSLWGDISLGVVGGDLVGIQGILGAAFCKEVLLPVVLGPIVRTEMPIFSLKYSLFVLKKLLPVLSNLQLLQILIRMLLIQQKIHYPQTILRKAFLQPFSLQKLLSCPSSASSASSASSTSPPQPQPLLQFGKLRETYQSILNSKDTHFQLIINNLICCLFEEVIRFPELSQLYGFCYHGGFSVRFNSMLVRQVKQCQILQTIQSTLHSLTKLHKTIPLQSDIQNQYIYIYQHTIQQLQNAFDNYANFNVNGNLNLNGNGNGNGNGNKEKFIDNFRILAESVQGDLREVFGTAGGDGQGDGQGEGEGEGEIMLVEGWGKYEKMYKIVFQWEVKEEVKASKNFYARVPDCAAEYLRYLFVKLLLLQKAKQHLLDNSTTTPLILSYYQKLLTKCPYITQDSYNSSQPQLKPLIQPCQFWFPPPPSSSCKCCPQFPSSPSSPPFPTLTPTPTYTPGYIIQDPTFLVLALPTLPTQPLPTSQNNKKIGDKIGQKIQIIYGGHFKYVGVEEISRKKMRVKVRVRVSAWCTELGGVREIGGVVIKCGEGVVGAINGRSQAAVMANLEFVKNSIKLLSNQLPSPSLI